MWTTQKQVPCWDLPAGLAGAQLGVKTPSPVHEGAFTTHLGNGLVVQLVVVLFGDRLFTRDSGDILSVDDTSDVVQCSNGNGSPPLVILCGL